MLCWSNGDCSEGEYCERDVGKCNGRGTCEAIPSVRPYHPVASMRAGRMEVSSSTFFFLIFLFYFTNQDCMAMMVCGCNGMIYMSMCDAAQQGVVVAHEGMC